MIKLLASLLATADFLERLLLPAPLAPRFLPLPVVVVVMLPMTAGMKWLLVRSSVFDARDYGFSWEN